MVDGPNLDYKFEKHDTDFVSYCCTTLNRSHFAMVAFKYSNDPNLMANRRFALINFQTQQVTDYSDLPFEDEFVHCSASVMHSKGYEKSLVIHLKANYQRFRHLMSYDLNQGVDGQWKIHVTWDTDYGSHVLNFWQIRGSFYSLLEDGNLVYHQNLNDWKSLTNISQTFSNFVGNGAVYYV